MKTTKWLLRLLALVLLASPTFADDAAKSVKAVTPEVQTANWAVKWWMPRHEQKLKDLKEQGQVDLLMIGDSITHGWESGGKAVWDEFYARRHAFNIGFSGDRTEQVLWRLDHGAVDGISPKLAVIMIGTNNAGHRQDPAEETAAGIKAIIADLQKRLPDTKILLLGIFPRGAEPTHQLRVINDATNEIISKYADGKKVVYLNINDRFLDANGVLTKEIMPDLLHPQAKGYRIWAEAMEPNIAKLLAE